MSKKKKKINTNDMEQGVFSTGFPMVDILTGRNHIIDVNKPEDYYRIRGIRSGCMIVAIGISGMGKTTLLLNMAGNLIRRYPYKDIKNTEPQIHYYAPENGAELTRICATTGIKYNQSGDYIKMYDRSMTTTDDMYEAIVKICEEKEKNKDLYMGDVTLGNNKRVVRYLPTMFIIDSISVLTPKQLKDKDVVDNMHAATRARINGNYLEKARNLASKYNIIIMGVKHETSNISSNPFETRKKRSYGSDVVSTGGSKSEFETDLEFRLDRIVAYDADKAEKKYKINDPNITSIIRANITKNRYNDSSGDMEFNLVQHRKYGFDPLHSYIYDVIDKTDIISGGKGGRYSLDGWDKTFYKSEISNLVQTESKFRSLIKKGIDEEYHEFLKYSDTDDILNKHQNLIDDLL